MKNDPKEQAAKNLDGLLATNRQFPENVFLERWDAFYFFDPDVLFESQFVEIVKALLAWENGAVACMRNLEATGKEDASEWASVFLNKETNSEAYMERLLGPTIGSGWLYQMYRYGCTSDIGSWCIYCERINEIAVIAVRRNSAPSQLEAVLGQLDALPINQAIENPPSYGLSSRGVSAEWRNKLLQEYSPSREQELQKTEDAVDRSLLPQRPPASHTRH